MLVLNKCQSITEVVVNGLKLCRSSFPKLWYWMIISAGSVFLWDLLGEYVVENSMGFFIEKGMLSFFILIAGFIGVSLFLAAFFECFICIRIHDVAINSSAKISNSMNLALKKTFRVLGVVVLFLIFLSAISGVFYVVTSFFGLNELFRILVVILFVYFDVFLFLSFFFILFDNKKILQSIKFSFLYTHKYFRELFWILLPVAIMVSIMSLQIFYPESLTLNDFLGWSQQPGLDELGDFLELFLWEILFFLSSGIGIVVFYHLKSKEKA